ncbi:endo-1,3(4)-beta-glucanase [[Emmonsia] crescens]|uniref:endo-1,3(4)-beta-glucanase n=1 Tax=[Emmonsia] crescens TaxID=73230 RepID=A0A2B7ZDW1_9EURO|nr:endo-1,3(4)-beta-glucanase [Emmonsia crescens]
MRTTKLALLAALAKLSAGSYVLQDDYQPSNFFDDFEFFDGADPSNAYVTYLDKSQAQKAGLASNENNFVYLGVEHNKVAKGSGRESVRLETKKTYKHGLIVADISHMPGGICGTWPAFWATGASWPDDGEFDIIEGVNRQSKNVVALHTTAGCKVTNNSKYSGQLITKDCDVFSPTQPGNQGCLFRAPSSTSYGTAFNNAGGGVYATEWTSDSISVWFFPRYQIPSDINSEHPDPSAWARPIAHFTGCEFDKFFQKQRIIFNTAFCGDWAKGTWNDDGGCAAKANTCEDYVKNNPQAFAEAYWSINYMKVYQNNPVPSPSATMTSIASSTTPQTSSSTKATTTTTSSTQLSVTKASASSSYPDSSSSSAEPIASSSYPGSSPSSAEPTAPNSSYPAEPTAPNSSYPASSPSASTPSEYPASSASNYPSADPTGLSSCTPPPTQSCVTYTTKTTIAIVVTPTTSDKGAVVPTPTEPAGYPTNDKYPALKRRQHIKEHAAGAHH